MFKSLLALVLRLIALGLFTFALVITPVTSVAAQAGNSQNPKDGAIGIQGKIPSNPPRLGATITAPTSGQAFSKSPITVAGLCPKGLLVKVFSNNVFVGAVQCENGSYNLLVDLFSGQNDLVARVYDSFDQAGPDSNIVKVTFNDSQFNPFGYSLLSLTSSYAQRGANPRETLTWPIILSGGTGPYAMSVDWGDNKAPDLISREFTGTIDLSHIYESAGVYKVTIKATDKNGLSAYLQLVAIANGAITSNTEADDDTKQTVVTRVMWLPAAISIVLVFVAFWLGRRYELAALRKHLESLDDQ